MQIKDENISDSVGIDRGANKEKWLAVTLSWFLPGAGHVYASYYTCGVILLLTKVFLHFLFLASLASSRIPVYLSPLLHLLGRASILVYACVDSFRRIKALDGPDLESNRSVGKNPWLAVFLSLLLPGAGHAYLRKGRYSLLFFVISIGLLPASSRAIQWLVVYTLFRAVVCAHAYTVGQIHRKTDKASLTYCLLLFVSAQCISRVLVPALNERFVVHAGGLAIGTSMVPTLRDGDRVVVSKLAYFWKRPKAGDVVAFVLDPAHDVPQDRVMVIKRIVAIGGEHVQLDGRAVVVDGQERRFSMAEDQQAHSRTEPALEAFGRENNPYLAYGVDERYHVPVGQYFVLGDNRKYSVDSRCYGAVREDRIIGKVVKIYLPFRRAGIVRWVKETRDAP